MVELPDAPQLIDLAKQAKAFNLSAKSTDDIFSDFTDALVHSQNAFHEFGRVYGTFLSVSKAYRRFAVSKNLRSKGPRKISWRRLTKLQRQHAILNEQFYQDKING